MVSILLLSFCFSALATFVVVASSHRHQKWSSDHDLSGPQKMHGDAVPRVGGLGIAAGVLAGAGLLVGEDQGRWATVALLMLCAAPTLLLGLVEDFTKAVRPRWRLLAPALSGWLGAMLLKIVIVRTGWGWFDVSFALPGVGVALTMFTCAGVVNSFNIIDGMNGLASMCAALMVGTIGYIALRVGDALVGGLALAAFGAALGFFVWNYPRGRIFLGDGGAYLLGLVAAELGVMLLCRNPAVSPLAPLLIVAYPVVETVFSMYRRRVIRGRAVSASDAIHLHTLIYRRLMRWAPPADDRLPLAHGNSMTSPFLWLLTLASVVPAVFWWDDTRVMALSIVLFTVLYLHLYWRIVRFRTPVWMVWLARRP